ncbi:MAG: hypothetical protein M1836_006855 [Candelina mexicana]|nr:MAG: hypothetical protein M1836_006855 [Candelina mexicana]
MITLLPSRSIPSSEGSYLPALPPPAGVRPNFVDPINRGEIHAAGATAIIVAMVILVTNRQYTKYFIIRKLGWDDLTCLLAEVITIIRIVILEYLLMDIWSALGHWDLYLLSLCGVQWAGYITILLVPLAMIFTKLTFFLMYLQLFQPLIWLRICVYIGATITTLLYAATAISQAVVFRPRKLQSFAAAPLLQKPGQARISQVMALLLACVGLSTDLYLLIVPITAVLQLQLPLRRKVGVVLMFSTGLLVLVNRSDDYTWTLLPANLWTIAEIGVGLCCVSMPALSKMLSHHQPYEKLKSRISSRQVSTKRRVTKGSIDRPTLLQRLSKTSRTRARKDYDFSLDLESNKYERPQGSHTLAEQELSPTHNSVKTIIGTGSRTPVELESGIRLKVNLHQSSQNCEAQFPTSEQASLEG